MSFNVRLTSLLLAYFIYACASVYAAVPEAINVEVAIKEAGEPLVGTHTVRVLIYSSSGADTASWEEVVSGVNFLNGNASISVGGLDINPFPGNLFDSTTLEMGIRINQKEVRVPIVAVPYSLRSGVSNTARRYEDPSKLFFDETSERVGVGTQEPIVRLDVNGGVKIGTLQVGADEVAGAIQWTGADFEVFDGDVWNSLTYVDDLDDESKWRLGGPGEIYADIASDEFVGFGESSPVYRMDVDGEALFDGELKMGGSLTIEDDLVVNSSHGLNAVGNLTGSALHLSTGNSWEDGEFRFSGVLTGNGSSITNVGAGAILDFAMNTLKFIDGSVTTIKMGTNSVLLNNVAPGVIALTKFATGAIDTNDIANGVITSAQIVDGSIEPHMIEVSSIATDNIPSGWLTREKIATGAITENEIADLAITTARLSNGVVSRNHFEDGVLDDEHFAVGAIGAGSIAPESIDNSLLGFIMALDQGGTGRSSWDSGAIPYVNGTGDGFLSDSHLVISDDNLGIGIQSPSYSVHVVQSTSSTLRTQVENADDLVIQLNRMAFSWVMGMDGAGGLEWALNSEVVPSMVLTSAGLLGIGVTTPTERLVVNGAVVLGNDLNPAEGSIYFNGSTLYGQLDLLNNIPLNTLFGGVSQAQNNTVGSAPGTDGITIGGGEDHHVAGVSNVILGGEGSGITGNYSTILGGQNNTVVASFSLILGGTDNGVTGDSSAILGGSSHSVGGDFSVVAGGESNRASGDYAVVSGGKLNRADADYSMVGGGTGNVVEGDWSVIVGGNGNSIAAGNEQRVKGGDNIFMALLEKETGIYASIIGGANNQLWGASSVIASGYSNALYGHHSVVAAGASHHLTGHYSGIAAGQQSSLSGDYSMIGAGRNHSLKGAFSLVQSGVGHRLDGVHSVVLSGQNNALHGDYSSVSGRSHQVDGNFNGVYGGNNNAVVGAHAQLGASTQTQINGQNGTGLSVAHSQQSGMFNTQLAQTDTSVSGYFNTSASGQHHRIDGVGHTQFGGNSHTIDGQYNTVVGGASNQANGRFSTVVGGQNNRAEGDYSVAMAGQGNEAKGMGSVAMGHHAKALHTGSFVWADRSSDQPVESKGDGSVTVRATGGVRVVNQAGELLAVLDSGSGSWAHVSDKNRKTDITPIDSREVLDRLLGLDVYYWHYKEDPNKTRHLGPMAQDFYRRFKLGGDATRINQVDADGVALSALSGLSIIMNEKERDLANLYGQVAGFNNAIKQLEAQIAYADDMMSRLEERAAQVVQVKGQIAVDQYEMSRILSDLTTSLDKEASR